MIFLGTKYNTSILFVEQGLAKYLSEYYQIICFEYPRFTTLFKLLSNRIPLLEKKSKNLIIYHSFGILPFGRVFLPINFLNHLINYMILQILLNKFISKIVLIITFTPEFSYISFISNYKLLIYHVTDNYKVMPWWDNFLSNIQLDLIEKSLIKKVDKVIVASSGLSKKYIKLSHDVILFSSPSNTKIYLQNSYKLKKIPKEISNISRPIVGFIGTIRDYNLDVNLISKAVRECPDFSFVFLGILDNKSRKISQILKDRSNCFYLGCKLLQEIPDYVSNFDVCIIPYITNEYGQYAYPVKIMEYLSLGKPVVTTKLPSIKYLAQQGLIYWSKNANVFIRNMKLALQEKNNKEIIQKRINEAKNNDWSIRIKDYLSILDER